MNELSLVNARILALFQYTTELKEVSSVFDDPVNGVHADLNELALQLIVVVTLFNELFGKLPVQ